MRGSVVLLLLAFALLIPGYVGSRPAFLGNYSNFAAPYESWSSSVHASVSCQKCHVSPSLRSVVGFQLAMIGEVYISPVAKSRQPDVLKTPPDAACEGCHMDLRTVSPSGDLRIPHRAHVRILRVKCVRCHSNLVHEKNASGKNTPAMTTCMECHDGDTAKDNCSACHANKAIPKTHAAADWLVVHPDMQAETDCAKCHAWTEKWCAECHSRRPASHAVKWRTNHRFAVERNRNCEACHKPDFCVRCHGERPSLNFDDSIKFVQ